MPACAPPLKAVGGLERLYEYLGLLSPLDELFGERVEYTTACRMQLYLQNGLQSEGGRQGTDNATV